MTDEELKELLGTLPEQAQNNDQPEVPQETAETAPLPDPFQPKAEPEPFAEAVPEPEQEAVREPRYIWVKLLGTLFVLAVLAFAVFCIIWDVQHGTASGGGYRAGNVVQVQIIQQDRSTAADTERGEDGNYTVAGIAAHIMPSIVEIYTYEDGTATGSGSGIILSEDGFIATNAHVVNGASSLSVTLFDEDQSKDTYDAVVIGHDTKTDLAVLKISASGLKPAVLGNSDQVQLGETVCALGNPAGLSGSITTGIISGMNRKVRAASTNFIMECFQTDAAISPGNSGGALVNMEGQVIGVTSSKYSSSSLFSGGAYEGLGFAITINEALPILEELMTQGYVSGRVRVGIQFIENSAALDRAAVDGTKLPDELNGTGILISSISEDSDLTKTQLQAGDWILTMNGQEVSDYDSIMEAIAGAVAGDRVHCRCGRVTKDGKLETFEIDFRLLEDQSGDY